MATRCNRAAAGDGSSSLPQLKVLEENHYYPFGLKHENYNVDRKSMKWESELIGGEEMELKRVRQVPNSGYQYKFQGQELQDELGLNWYTFKYRNYMPDIGRFFNVDPLSEKYSYQSHYNFAENKVIDHIELEGLEGVKHTLVNKAGNNSYVVEKNVIILTQKLNEIPQNATPKQIEKIEKSNSKISESNQSRINEITGELNKYYGIEANLNFKNSKDESVSFKINIQVMEVDDPSGMTNIDGQSMIGLSQNQGLDSAEGCVPAAIFSTSPPAKGSMGSAVGNWIKNKASNAPTGTWAHEFIHSLDVKDNGYNKGGILNFPPQPLIKSEVDEILNNAKNAN